MGVAFVLIGALVTSIVRHSRREALKEQKLEREGQVVVAWIVFANNQLYQLNDPDSVLPAQVVFTLVEGVPNLEEVLAGLA